jgi:hypothetical protein
MDSNESNPNVVEIAGFLASRARRNGAASSGATANNDAAKALVTVPAEQPPGTVAVDSNMVRKHVHRLCKSLQVGLGTLSMLDLDIEQISRRVQDGLTQVGQVTSNFPMIDVLATGSVSPVVYVTPEQIQAKDKLLAEMVSYQTLVYTAISLAVEHLRLLIWLETTVSAMPSENLHIAPGAEVNDDLLAACDFAREGKVHLERCSSLLSAAGLAIAGERLKEAREFLKAVDGVAMIFSAVQHVTAEGKLVDLAG